MWEREFKLFILLVLFLIQVGLVVWVMMRMSEEGTIDWARSGATLVLGILVRELTIKRDGSG